MDITDRGTTNVRLMYEKVASILYDGVKESQRSTQLKWHTVRTKLRKKVKKDKAAAANTYSINLLYSFSMHVFI